jgi:nitric oxide reductase NorQ protein
VSGTAFSHVPPIAAPVNYFPVADEVALFEAAAAEKLAVMLKGPTGCGKTRFVEYMARRLGRALITVPCHEDISATDLLGRHVLKGNDTIWVDGPATRAVRSGSILYLDEVVEARADATVVIHPLADHRRQLHIDRLDVTLQAPDSFMLVLSYNPGYQSALKDLKESTRQRMVGIDFDYPPTSIEEAVLRSETGLSPAYCRDLVKLGQAIRRIETAGLREVASTRTLIAAGKLVRAGCGPRRAAIAAIASALSDEASLIQGLTQVINTYIPA